MSHSQSKSSTDISTTTTSTSDSYNRTFNESTNLSDVGNTSLSFNYGPSTSGMPEIGSILPIAIGFVLIGLFLLFKK